MLWLSLHLPNGPLEALLPLPPEWLATGVCVVERIGSAAPVVVATSAAARAAGVRPGQGAATAAALAPQVRACPRDPAREAALIEQLALALGRYTPQVALEPDGVLLEVQASLRLFGGVRPLLRAVRESARAFGVTPRLGVAPAPLGATLLARLARRSGGRPCGAQALQTPRLQRLLAPLPVQAALPVLALQGQIDARRVPHLSGLLQGIGCHALEGVRALPRSALSRREGGALLAALDRAFGDAPDPREIHTPPPSWRAELELLHRADDAAMLVFATQRLLQPLSGWLARQWLAATRLALHLRHESSSRSDRTAQPDTVLHLELAQPSRDAAQLLTVLRERLQRLPLPAPVYHLALVLDAVQAHAGTQAQWLPDAQAQAEGWATLLDRLRARLGDASVQRLALHADHRPERAFTPCTAVGGGASLPLTAQEPAPHGPARPTWLLPEPLPLHVVDGTPMHGGRLTLLSGPERIEAGWFDGALAVRDYFVAAGPDHRLRWIFRGPRPGPHSGPDAEAAASWFLHGWFA